MALKLKKKNDKKKTDIIQTTFIYDYLNKKYKDILFF